MSPFHYLVQTCAVSLVVLEACGGGPRGHSDSFLHCSLHSGSDCHYLWVSRYSHVLTAEAWRIHSYKFLIVIPKIIFLPLPSIPMTCNAPCTINGCLARKNEEWALLWEDEESFDWVREWILSIHWRVTEIANLHNERAILKHFHIVQCVGYLF